MKNTENGTKGALLEAAVTIFAAKGFLSATVRDICQLAGANVAAVNYHFGGKDALYTAVLKHVFARVRAEMIRQEDIPEADYSPEKRLDIYIRRKLTDIYTSTSPSGAVANHWAIFLMEIAHPSDNLNMLIEEYVQPAADELRSIVGEILEESVESPVVQDCAISIWAQLIDPLVMMPITDRMIPPRPRVQEDMNRFADHLVMFTLGGLQAIRKSFPAK